MTPWYVVFCQPRRENVAEANLLNQGYKVFLPKLIERRRYASRWREKIAPMFPRYLFLAPHSQNQSLSLIRSTLGVSGLVRFGTHPATVPSRVIDSLRDLHDPHIGAVSHFRCDFTVGDAIEFRRGPLEGLAGVFDSK